MTQPLDERLYAKLGLCSFGGWGHVALGRVSLDLTVKGGGVVACHPHRVCQAHLESALEMFVSGPHEVELTLDDGTVVAWEDDGDETP